MYQLKKSKQELTFEEKRALVDDVNAYGGGYEDLMFYDNEEEFFETFFEGRPAEAVRATYFGHYEFAAPLVRVNVYGNLDTFYESDAEEEIDGYLDDVLDNFARLLADGNVDDYYDLFEEIDEEDAGEDVLF